MQKRTLYFFTLLLLIWFGVSLISSEFGALNYDEPWYLTASYLAVRGQLPYRDFAFTQGPLLPYVYGPALGLIGVNLAIGRLLSVALSLVALAFVLNMTHQMAGTRAASLAFVLLIATPDVLYYLAIVKTYSLVAVLTLLALTLVFYNGPSPWMRGPFPSTVVAGLAVLTRLSFLPVLGLVFLFWVWRGRWRASGLGLLVLGLVVLVIAASSNGNLLFDILEFHLRIAPTADSTLAVKTTLASAIAIGFAPALTLALFLLVLWRKADPFRRRLAGWWHVQMDSKILLLLVAIALGIVHFVAPGEFWEYQVPGYLLVVVLLATISSLVGGEKSQPAWTLILAVCVLVSSAPAWIYRFPELWRPTNTLLSASRASKVLAQRGRPGDTLLGGFNHLALASGLQIYPGNEMGRFSVAADLSVPEATWRRLLSEKAVTHALDSCDATFAVTDKGKLFPISVPSTLDLPAAIESQWRRLLQDKYRTIYSEGVMTIFQRVEKCNNNAPPPDYDGRLDRSLVGRPRFSSSSRI